MAEVWLGWKVSRTQSEADSWADIQPVAFVV